MSGSQYMSLAVALCSFANSKRNCGEILDVICDDMEDEGQAVGFIDEVMHKDFFLDLKGRLKEFLKALPRFQSNLSVLIAEKYKLGEDGEIVESDEDQQGNLKDFVVDDDVWSVEDGSDEAGGDECEEEGSLDEDRSRERTKKKRQRSRNSSTHEVSNDDSQNDNEDDEEEEEDDVEESGVKFGARERFCAAKKTRKNVIIIDDDDDDDEHEDL